MDTFFIKPVNPAICPRDPDTGERLAAEGEDKPVNTYWLRRQLHGEVEVVASPNGGSASDSKSAKVTSPHGGSASDSKSAKVTSPHGGSAPDSKSAK